MRFNSIEHLAAWASRGIFPAIHDAIATAVGNLAGGERVLDLCCSFGLLGERLKQHHALDVAGIDGDITAIEQGRAAGISISLHTLKIAPATLADAVDILKAHRTQTIVARRCLPELFGHDADFGREFLAAAKHNGVFELFLEGRVKTLTATNRLASIDDEVRLASGLFVEHRRLGNISYLRAA